MKTFGEFTEETKKITKNPYVDSVTGVEKKNWAGNVETGPDIHGLKSGNKYPNNIMDLPDSSKLKKQYFNEPETKKYFKNNPKIKMQFYMEKNQELIPIHIKKANLKKVCLQLMHQKEYSQKDNENLFSIF